MSITKKNSGIIAILLLGFFIPAVSQNVTLSGYVKDKKSGETLIGATIYLADSQDKGTVSNEYGFYSLTIPSGDHTVAVQFIGYQAIQQKIAITQSQKLNFDLEPDEGVLLQEVTVSASKTSDGISEPLFGVERIDMVDVKNIPVLFGERDVLKTIQLLPGVKSAGEGNAGFHVRGGAADQNLILLDEALVYNPSHLLGFFSTFNSDAIKDATLYKGGMPPHYGGRLSSVLDIKMKEGNNQDFEVSGGIGVIASRLTVEGPLEKGKSSFIVSGRRTYLDLFLRASPEFEGTQLYFYDLNAKVNYRLSEKDRLFLSGYFGRDQLGTNAFGIDWGNTTGTARWNHLFSDKLFSNTTFIFSNYNNNIEIQSGDNDFRISSQIRDYSLRQDFQWFPNSDHKFRFGFESTYHTVTPSSIIASEESGLNDDDAQARYGLESAIWLTHDWKVAPKFNLLYGVRLSDFAVLGDGDFYTYDADGNTLTTTTYGSGELVKNYFNLEPRVSASYTLTSESSLKLAYNRNTQYLHLLSNSSSTSPTDLWMLTNNNVKPEIADQVALGYFRQFGKNRAFEFSAETYYKWMQNQIDYRNGAQVQGNNNVESELLFGDGRAYGLELQVKKNAGKLTGWLSYTLSRTERKIPGVNNDNYYPARQDRTHDISVVGSYQLSNRWTLSANWVYQTGNAVTFPSGKYEINGTTQFHYTSRNGYRMPAYHRLDIGVTFQGKKTKKIESEWAFSLYNAYNRMNAFSITFQDSTTNPGTTEALRTALFGIVPSLAWNFKF